MNRRAYVLASVGVPYLICTIIPSAVFGLLYGQWGTNIIWGVIFGFGWWVAQSIGGPEHWRVAAAIGVLVWVPIVLGGLFLLSRFIWKSGSDRTRQLFLLALAVSCLPILPAETAMSLYADARVPPDFNVLWASW
jgi:hypothetical protein